MTHLDGTPYSTDNWRSKYIGEQSCILLFFFDVEEESGEHINIVFKSKNGYTLHMSTCRLGKVIYDPDTGILAANTKHSIYMFNLRI